MSMRVVVTVAINAMGLCLNVTILNQLRLIILFSYVQYFLINTGTTYFTHNRSSV